MVLFCYACKPYGGKKTGTSGIFEILQKLLGIFEIFEKLSVTFEFFWKSVGKFEIFWKYSGSFEIIVWPKNCKHGEKL